MKLSRVATMSCDITMRRYTKPVSVGVGVACVAAANSTKPRGVTQLAILFAAVTVGGVHDAAFVAGVMEAEEAAADNGGISNNGWAEESNCREAASGVLAQQENITVGSVTLMSDYRETVFIMVEEDVLDSEKALFALIVASIDLYCGTWLEMGAELLRLARYIGPGIGDHKGLHYEQLRTFLGLVPLLGFLLYRLRAERLMLALLPTDPGVDALRAALGVLNPSKAEIGVGPHWEALNDLARRRLRRLGGRDVPFESWKPYLRSLYADALPTVGNLPVPVPKLPRVAPSFFSAEGSEMFFVRGVVFPWQDVDFTRTFREVVSLLQETVDNSTALAYWPAGGTLIGLLRYGTLRGHLAEGRQDATDIDVDWFVEFDSHLQWSEWVDGIVSALSAIGWACHLGSNFEDLSPVWTYDLLSCGLTQEDGVAVTDFHRVLRVGNELWGFAGSLLKTWNGRLPLEVVHPLARCLAYGLDIPCPRDADAFLTGYNGGEYDTESWCIALPKCTSWERTQESAAWLESGITVEVFSQLRQSWNVLEADGYASMSSLWRSSPACRRAAEALEGGGPPPGAGLKVGSERIEGVWSVGLDTLTTVNFGKARHRFAWETKLDYITFHTLVAQTLFPFIDECPSLHRHVLVIRSMDLQSLFGLMPRSEDEREGHLDGRLSALEHTEFHPFQEWLRRIVELIDIGRTTDSVYFLQLFVIIGKMLAFQRPGRPQLDTICPLLKLSYRAVHRILTFVEVMNSIPIEFGETSGFAGVVVSSLQEVSRELLSADVLHSVTVSLSRFIDMLVKVFEQMVTHPVLVPRCSLYAIELVQAMEEVRITSKVSDPSSKVAHESRFEELADCWDRLWAITDQVVP